MAPHVATVGMGVCKHSRMPSALSSTVDPGCEGDLNMGFELQAI